MALSSALNRGKYTPVLGSAIVAQRQTFARQTVSPLYENINSLAQSLIDRLNTVDSQHLPRMVNVLSIEFKTTPQENWRELFTSADDFNQSLADGMKRVGIGISSGLMFGGFKQCRVKRIRFDPDSERFIIDLHWLSEPSRLKKLLTRRH